jgi:glutamate-1-semialdehyde 2,1-aminomutase
MTSRLSPSGLQAILGLLPDLTTFGKYLGGGLAFGAFGGIGGRGDIMEVYDPRSLSALAHSGTFNNNTLAMHAGFTGLSEIWKPDVAIEFNQLGDYFREALKNTCRGTRMSVTGRGTLNAIHFSEKGVANILCREDI